MADVVVDPSVGEFIGHRRNQVVKNASEVYAFFEAGGPNGFVYRKSIDGGQTYAASVAISTESEPFCFDIYYARWTDPEAPNYVYLVWDQTISSTKVMFAVLDLDTDTFQTPETEIHTISAISAVTGEISVTYARDGGIVATGSTWTGRSTDGGETWTTRAAMGESTVQQDQLTLWPDFSAGAAEEDVIGVYFDRSEGEVTVKQLDVSANSVTETSVTTADAGLGGTLLHNVTSSLDDAGLVLIAAIDETTSPASLLTFTVNGSTVTAKTDVLTTADYISAPAIAHDTNGDIRVFYGRSYTESFDEQGLYYKLSDDGMATWGDETQISEAVSYSLTWGMSDPRPQGIIIPMWYHRNGADLMVTGTPIEVGGGDPDPPPHRLMLAETDTPDVPELNITSHNVADEGETLVRFERGYSSAVLGEPPAAAQMSATLTGDYDLDEPVPGLAMQLNKKDSDGTWHHLCTVNLDIPAHAMTADHFRDEIQAVGYGRFAKLAGKTVSTELFEDIPTGFAINELLDAAGFPADMRDIDAGEVNLPWWWVNNGDVMAELNKLRYSEGITSDLYEDGEGKIVFRSRSARFTEQRSVQAQASFTTSGDEPRLTGFEYHSGHREVINSASHARNVRFEAGAPSVVWEDVDPPGGHYIVMPGLPITVLAEASEPFKDAITPVAATDYSIVSFGSTITPTLERTSGQRTKITFTATGAGGAIINQLQLRATSVPLDQSVVETSTVDASDSIEAYGQRPWQGEMSAELEWTDMRDNLDVIVNWKKDPRARVRFGLGAYRGTEANDQTAQRDIGDRVRVVTSLRKHGVGAMTFDGDIWIQRIEHEVRAPASSSDGSLPADEFTWYEGIVISVAPGSSGSGVGGNNPYDEVDNGQSESPTTGLTDQGLLMRGIIGPLFGVSDTPTITPPPGDPGAPPTPPVEGTTAGLVGFGRFNHDAYDGTFHMTSGTAGQIASMRAALLDGARVIIDSGTLVKVSSNIIMGENSQLLSPLDGSGASIQATAPCEIIDIGRPNVRVQNLLIHNFGDTDGDENQRCINIQGGNARDYWIDKCTFDHDQQNNGVAYGETINIFAFPTAADAAGDGTVSRCYFLGKTSDGVETKALTIGAKHELDIDAAENTRVTIYQCVFEAWQRQAIQRKSAKVHYINCVYPEKNRIYGIGVTDGSHAVIEGCVFYGSTQANRWEVNANASGESVDNTARIYVPTSSGELRTGFSANGINLLLNDAAVNDVNPTLAFNPASFYGYTVSAATEVLAAAIIAAAGRG